ncbi:MAG: hypothetical protein IPM92_04555 [Saprospiraceae bacterium]|nr:hypothetical protein [Saprospiraceae bacterium]
MNPTIKNILAVVAGIIVGSIVNMSLISISGSVIPPPEGADVTTMEGLKATLALFQPKHFIMPFLAHALGTLAGAFVAAKFAAERPFLCGMVVAAFFLMGGIANVFMLPSPMWFNILDLVGAYLPMGFLGIKLVMRNQ